MLKKLRQTLKTEHSEFSMLERDYRGLISILLVLGLVMLLWKGDYQSASVLGPLAGTSVGWYFSKQREGENIGD